MFYLTTHSTHFIYGYMLGLSVQLSPVPRTRTAPRNPVWTRRTNNNHRKEGNVLFNDTLNTFYLRLYGVRHMVKDHSGREKGNLLSSHRLLFQLTARVLLYAPTHRQDCTYHGLCYTSRGALAGTRNSSMGSP